MVTKWRPFFILSVILVMAFVTIGIPHSGEAKTIQQINRELDELQRKMNAAQKKAREMKRQMEQKAAEKNSKIELVNQLQEQIYEAEEQLAILDSRIVVKESELEQSQQELQAVEERLLARDELLQSRLRLMYTNGTVSYLEVLLSATSFTDFLDRFNGLQALVVQDKKILEDEKKDRELKAQKTAEIIEQLNELTALYEQQEAAIADLWEKRNAAQVAIASINEEMEHLAHYTEEQERMLNNFLAEQTQLLRERNLLMSKFSGKLVYPLPQAYRISSEFGYRTNPITGAKGEFHKGIDFAAPKGTDILAAGDGIVVTARFWGGYGNTVVIDHGGGLQTLYAHGLPNGIKVKEGETVKAGQKIMEVGTTGSSTGYHLHFEVRKNGNPVNPRDYLSL